MIYLFFIRNFLISIYYLGEETQILINSKLFNFYRYNSYTTNIIYYYNSYLFLIIKSKIKFTSKNILRFEKSYLKYIYIIIRAT